MEKRETKWQRMEASAVGTSKAHLANSLVLLVTAGAVLTLLLAYLFGTPLWVAALAFAYWVGVLRLGVWIGGKFTVPERERREEFLSQPPDPGALEARRRLWDAYLAKGLLPRPLVEAERRFSKALESKGLLPEVLVEEQRRLIEALEAELLRATEDMEAEQ